MTQCMYPQWRALLLPSQLNVYLSSFSPNLSFSSSPAWFIFLLLLKFNYCKAEMPFLCLVLISLYFILISPLLSPLSSPAFHTINHVSCAEYRCRRVEAKDKWESVRVLPFYWMALDPVLSQAARQRTAPTSCSIQAVVLHSTSNLLEASLLL